MESTEARNDFENPQNEEESDSEPAPIEPSASDEAPLSYVRLDGTIQKIEDDSDAENTPEVNMKRFARILGSKRLRREEEIKRRTPSTPRTNSTSRLTRRTGRGGFEGAVGGCPDWDDQAGLGPELDDDEVEVISEEIKAGRDPPIAPFYVPYRKYYPAIPDNHYDISNPKAVIEELDRIEEFLIWVSFIFKDGSS